MITSSGWIYCLLSPQYSVLCNNVRRGDVMGKDSAKAPFWKVHVTGLSCSLWDAPSLCYRGEAPRRPPLAESRSAPLRSNRCVCSASWISGRARWGWTPGWCSPGGGQMHFFLLAIQTQTDHLHCVKEKKNRCAYLIECPRHSSPLIVHHWTSHYLPSSLKKHQGRQLLSQRGRANLVPVQRQVKRPEWSFWGILEHRSTTLWC